MPARSIDTLDVRTRAAWREWLRYVGWVDSAKREETKQRRLLEAVALLAKGRKLGLK